MRRRTRQASRTSFVLPVGLRTRAKRQARAAGVSLGEFMRRAIEAAVLASEARTRDPIFDFQILSAPPGTPKIRASEGAPDDLVDLLD